MILTNKILNATPTKWRIDDDGFMRVTACILKDGVYPYLPAESPDIQPTATDGNVYHLIEVARISADALKSIEGKPVIQGEHDWQTATDNAPVGSVAGSPSIVNGELLVDLLITDEQVKQAIKAGDLIEISAAYESELIPTAGDYQGTHFDCIQKPIHFNHVLLLPSGCGRCGSDVKIINTKTDTEVKVMANIVKLENGKKYRFNNEDDAAVAEEMASDVKSFNAEELQNAMNELTEVKNQVAELEKRKAELEAQLKEVAAQLEAALSPEHQAELAEEAKQQNEDEDAVIAAEVNEGEQEAVKAECQNSKTYADRRSLLVRKVLNSKGVKTDAFTAEAFDGAFEALVATAKAKIANAKQVMGGAKVANSAPVSNLDRILRPMSK